MCRGFYLISVFSEFLKLIENNFFFPCPPPPIHPSVSISLVFDTSFFLFFPNAAWRNAKLLKQNTTNHSVVLFEKLCMARQMQKETLYFFPEHLKAFRRQGCIVLT